MAAAYLRSPEIEVVQFCSKCPFASRQNAERIMKRLRDVTGLIESRPGRANAYQCGYCQLWHIGHTTR